MKKPFLSIVLAAATLLSVAMPSLVQAAPKQPNILFIMGDDIGIMNVGAYHRGLMVGETPNIDRIAQEGALFMTAYAPVPYTHLGRRRLGAHRAHTPAAGGGPQGLRLELRRRVHGCRGAGGSGLHRA